MELRQPTHFKWLYTKKILYGPLYRVFSYLYLLNFRGRWRLCNLLIYLFDCILCQVLSKKSEIQVTFP